MNDSPQSFDYDACQPDRVSSVSAAIWPAVVDKLEGHTVVRGELKARRYLPLFCSPIALFIINWTLMLCALSVHVTYVSYPYMGMPLLLCGLSIGSFLLGYAVSRTTLNTGTARDQSLSYTLDITMLRRLNLLLCVGALLIIAFNWATLGPPPALGHPASYLTYGRFKQVLFPLLVSVTVNATLESSRPRKVIFAMFGIAGMAVYITRGLLLVTLLQMLFVFALKTRIEKKKLYWVACGAGAFAIVAITLMGNARTAQGVFLEYLQIRQSYANWPMAYLWLTSYISIPFSNLCWLFSKAHFHGPTFAFLYPLLPSFLTPADPHAAIHGDLSIIDGASTYLAAYALDFSYLGVYLANLALGLGCGWLVERSLPKQILVSSIFLTCLSLIFFSDMFTPLSTIIQILIQTSVQRKCFHWGESHDASVVAG
jgi:oligosaccharide repeat unit polymerase